MINISEKPLKKYLINAGIYVVNPEIIKDLVHGERIDMTDIITASINKESVGIFPMHEQWIDIGSHESFEKQKNNQLLVDYLLMGTVLSTSDIFKFWKT